MSQIKTLNGVQYTIPQYSDTGWGANTGNVLTQYLAAIADVTLQLSGGSFTLTSEVDFGSSFGLKALYLKTETANPASAGLVRLASTDVINWRNNANSGNVSLSTDTSDNLQWNATKVLLSGAVVNADINAAAAIAYSKLNLTGSIVNADINASAAIATSKLAALNASVCPVTDASGFLTSSAVTATELSFVHGVTSAIQTQINGLVANPLSADLNFNSHKGTNVANGTASGDAVAFGQVSGKRIMQIVTATTTSALDTTSSTYQSTNLTASITPASTSSKVRVTVTGDFLCNNPSSTTAEMTVFRGATDLGSGTPLALVGGGALTSTIAVPVCIVWVDSPASASSVTYTVKILSTANNASFHAKFPNLALASIILEEIG